LIASALIVIEIQTSKTANIDGVSQELEFIWAFMPKKFIESKV
jgi:hypothetical protein